MHNDFEIRSDSCSTVDHASVTSPHVQVGRIFQINRYSRGIPVTPRTGLRHDAGEKFLRRSYHFDSQIRPSAFKFYQFFFISCMKTVLDDSPNHPRLLLALTRNRPCLSTTASRVGCQHQKNARTRISKRTQLRDSPSVVSRYDLELHTTLHPPADCIRLPCLCDVPQSNIIRRRTVHKP